MIWDRLRGHRSQIEMFRRTIENGRLSHAYVLLGPAGVGKQLFAHLLAQCLLCPERDDRELDACGECPRCKSFTAGTDPDFLRVGLPPGKRQLPVHLFVGVDEQRHKGGLCHDLSLRPMAGARKIAIVDDADLMNEESANAFLKTLEEPPEYALLLLIAANSDALLPTIRSRCQVVRFAGLPASDVAELLLAQELTGDADEAQAAAALGAGGLEVARRLLDPDTQELRQTLYSELAREPFNGRRAAEKLLEAIEAAGAETVFQREAAGWMLRFAVEFFRHALLALSSGPRDDLLRPAVEFSRRFTAENPDDLELLGSVLERTVSAAAQLEQNAAVGLCMETLLADLERPLGGGVSFV